MTSTKLKDLLKEEVEHIKLLNILQKMDNHQLNGIVRVLEYTHELNSIKEKEKAELKAILYCKGDNTFFDHWDK